MISCGRPPKPPSSTSYLDAKKQEIWKRAPRTCPRFPNFPIRMRRCPPAAAQAISWALRFSERAGSSHPAAPQRLTQTDGRPAPRGQTPDRPPPLGAAPQTNGGGGTGDGPRAGSGVGREETTPARTSPRRAPGLLRRAAHAHSWRRTPLRPWEARSSGREGGSTRMRGGGRLPCFGGCGGGGFQRGGVRAWYFSKGLFCNAVPLDTV